MFKSLNRRVDSNGGYNSLGKLLSQTPLLEELSLSFLGPDCTETEEFLAGLAKSKEVLPSLKELSIHGMHCDANDFVLFLQSHNSLRRLSLLNMGFNCGPEDQTFVDILNILADFMRLRNFRCNQIAQNSFKITFPSLCHLEIDEYGREWDELTWDVEITWPNVWIKKYPYKAVAEKWEGVSQKLRGLSRDAVVTATDRGSDDDYGYHWSQ